MAAKQFKAESKRLLDLMINSVYTHKEIFLREIISNASDAIDKLYYKALTEPEIGLSREDFYIEVRPDKQSRTLMVIDNGIGMTKEEMESNLGTIARSGSWSFKNENEQKEEIDIIGKFGVGFYSVFMVSQNVRVESRAYGSDTAWVWESAGAEGYTIKECAKESHGTVITLSLKQNSDDDNFDDYLNEHRIKTLIKKYSDYIRYPIKMDITKSRPVEGEEGKFESYTETEVQNSMVPIWRRNKSELSAEDYNDFYKNKFFDYEDPLKYIHMNAEGTLNYNAVLYVPAHAPYDYYTRDFEKGLALYSSGVLIMDKCPDLLPEHFRFMRGLVDSQDLQLNLSREMLQHDRQLKAIGTRLEKRIKTELVSMLTDEREKYEKFFGSFGLQLKYGMVAEFGAHKELLADLLMFRSSFEDKLTTFAEYKSRMKEEQKFIYYAPGESVEKIKKLPQLELVLDAGMEILFLTEDVDEFALQAMREFDGVEFKSVNSDDLGIESADKDGGDEQAEENKELLEFMKEALGDRVADVRVSKKLKTHPVLLTSDGGLSLEMEKVLNAMPSTGENKVKAERVLEINASHKIFGNMRDSLASDREKAKDYAEILYNQALLIAGFDIDDPVEYANMVCKML